MGEPDVPPQIERMRHLADAAAWRGQFVVLPRKDLPERFEYLDWSQDLATSTERIRRELGYREIVPYEVGLSRMVQWQRAHPNDKLAPTAEQYADDDRILAGIHVRGDS